MSTKRKLIPIFLLVIILAVIVFLVTAGPASDLVATAFGTASKAGPVASPDATPAPLATLPPTATPEPTATAVPVPTATPEPTATPTPLPEPTATPVVRADEPKVAFAQRFTFRKTDTVQYLKPGVIHIKRQQTGPQNINILLFDLTAPEFSLRVALPNDWLSGVSRTSTLAKENNALAAVNGDLFSGTGLPQGMTMSDGKLALAPKRRATFAYSSLNGPFIGYFTQGFTWPSSVVAANGERHSLGVLNSTCKEDWLCIYNDLFRTLPAGYNEVKVILNSLNQVVAIHQEGRLAIETGQQVLLGKGQAARWLLQNVKAGDKLELNMITDPPYQNFEQIVSGGPVFLRNGEFIQDCMCTLDDCSESKEKDLTCEEFSREWKDTHYQAVRMPRNGIGYNADKSVLVVAVVDGYQPGFSIGMTQREFADLFREFGADTAMELDGGGSATMWVNGKLASRPSDGSGTVERMVPNAVVFKWNGQDSQVETGSPASATTGTVTAGAGLTPSTTLSTTPAPTNRAAPRVSATPAPTPTRDPVKSR